MPDKLKVLHTGDIHARDRDIDEVEKCTGKLVAEARSERPDLIVIAGDVFDSNDVKVDSNAARLIVRVVSELADVAPVAVIIGTPTHDGETSLILSYVRGGHGIWVADSIQQVFLSGEEIVPECADPRAVISLVPQPSKRNYHHLIRGVDIATSDRDVAEALSLEFEDLGRRAAAYGKPHVLVGHWNTSGAYISDTQVLTGVDIEISTGQMARACAHVNCLGHIHKRQQMGANTFYCGSLYRCNRGEDDAKGFYIHTIAVGRPTESRFIETPTRKYSSIRVDMTESGSPAFGTAIEAGAPAVKGACVKVEVQAYQDESGKIDRQAIRQKLLEAGAADVEIAVKWLPRVNVRGDEVLRADSLRDKLIAQAALRGETVSEGILSKADLLDGMKPEDIYSYIIGGEIEADHVAPEGRKGDKKGNGAGRDNGGLFECPGPHRLRGKNGEGQDHHPGEPPPVQAGIF